MHALLAQAQMELRLTLRSGEGLLVTLIVPPALLVFFAALHLAPSGYTRPIDFLLPSMLALAVMSIGLVSLGIRTAYERHYGVLKRLGATPLGRGRLIGAKILSVLAVEVLQLLLLGGAAFLFGWRPTGALAVALVTLLLGTAVFASLGLFIAGTFRAETTLGLANGLYVLFILLGGVAWPLDRLPGPIALVGLVLPSNALASALRASLSPEPSWPLPQLGMLALWTALILLVARRTFRWE
ncbi:ABC transporter permease [Thermomicrobium sp. 4228-Ro]|uniref:ABC transporter permease n=1 Tax=Thermomicrobium sp. 4228-Ro TaxID=2993937 RepID=UPI002249A05A|nr:ABC transporter permease [Thermomicrobium sp. 4228-Ro]MCX2727578.1 ABC transporter permease [Thermomicrobium sp. 4228-Ro]